MDVANAAQGVCSGFHLDPLPCRDVLDEVSPAPPAIDRFHLLDIEDAVCVYIPSKSHFEIVCRRPGELDVEIDFPCVGTASMQHDIGRNLGVGKNR